MAIKLKDWRKGLKKTLTAKFKKQFPRTRKELMELAIQEILNGVSHCYVARLRISVTLNGYFSIKDEFNCLIALNTSGKTFEQGLRKFGISMTTARYCGFCLSRVLVAKFNTIYPFADPGEGVEWWQRKYQCLWRWTGEFFRDNPQFGMK